MTRESGLDYIHEIGLVASSWRQRGTICRATDQFSPSPVFRRARDYCERAFDEWYILTPRYPLALPHQVVGPCTMRIADLGGEERICWVAELSQRLGERWRRSRYPIRFVLFSGARTAELVQRAVPFAEVVLPHAGLSLAERMRWYDERLPRDEWSDSRVLAAVSVKRATA
ncbi:MAG TPA: hypothetical protein VF120_11660 [Ktedonobacterales bacterium]